MPKVSVCIPTYNNADTLAQAIESALNQSFEVYEVIITDNASNDNTEQVVNSFDDGRISYFRNTKNIGMVGNWNRCFDLSKGQYVLILHADDVLHPKIIEYELKVFEHTKNNLAIVATNATKVEGKKTAFFPEISGEPVFSIFNPEDIGDFVIKYRALPCSSVLFDKQKMEKVGKFSPEFEYSTDEELWTRVLWKGFSIAVLRDKLVAKRKHESYAFTTWQKSNFAEQYKKIFERTLYYCNNDPEIREFLEEKYVKAMFNVAFHLYRSGASEAGLKLYKEEVSSFPFYKLKPTSRSNLISLIRYLIFKIETIFII